LFFIVAVVAMLALAPGHGVWEYIISFLALALLGATVGLLGRKYPQVYGQRSRRRGSPGQ
jgi:VIT1/CCC1 family predicted Fe2+/Mn2+ transporter